ncbi:MAG: phosphatidylinositol mannoside acyltransferase [Actinomyces sp.]|uniref:phosphatidylinositol mannoside acyltransferase n=1 Tax=Actinomyces sp. TaxID=29317 RepID=UPI0026DD85C2|nr:phosphatidylinositol mannoside acyltransferase [Actinomyces sp.]MDO4244033.1 phosphatidylinositol mannoside acyltransferase [Actinomyces sp.]
MRRPGVQDLYRLAWRHAHRLPAGVGYALSALGADAAWAVGRLRGGRGGVGQLERNLARLLPPSTTRAGLHRTTRLGMRSYMRYFYEAFALTGMSDEQILARVRGEIDPAVHDDLRHGSVVVALAHTGNWDLAAAWACRELATVLTVAERLEPADLYEQFIDFRQGLGMRIIGQGHGEKVFDALVAAASDGGTYLIPLLADRDLSSAGVAVDLAGHRARVAAGPAALAQALGRPLYVGVMHYERLTGERRRRAGSPWGVVVTIRALRPPQGATARERVVAATHDWARAMGTMLAEYAVDWHMLQAVFEDDLDPERLARRHAAEQDSQQTGKQTGDQNSEPTGNPARGDGDSPRTSVEQA